MNFEELKRLWQSQNLDAPSILSPDKQLALTRMKMKALDRASLLVDALSVLSSALIILFFTWQLLKIPYPAVRLGLLICIATVAFWILEPIRARRLFPQTSPDAPVTQWLHHELEKIHAQSTLKGSRLWSLLPLWLGTMLMTWGLPTSLSSQISFSAFLTGLYLVLHLTIRKFNQYAWRKGDLPLIQELESLLKSNTPE